jgi:hypothetical protein
MTRRLFWLTLGAGLGISGYRRATRIVRGLTHPARAEALAAFARDVREGMELYAARQGPDARGSLGSRRAAERADIGPRQATGGHTLDYTR